VELIKQLKVSSLKKHESIEIVCPTQGFESLGGLKAIKDFCLKSLMAMTSQKKQNPEASSSWACQVQAKVLWLKP